MLLFVNFFLIGISYEITKLIKPLLKLNESILGTSFVYNDKIRFILVIC